MFGKKITLFSIFGFRVSLDLSWLVLGALITFTLAKGVFPQYVPGLTSSVYWMMGVGGALGLFFSIVFHELWHSLVARRFGLQMKGITLFIFGGVAEMSEEPPSPKAEFFMALAGPVSSVILGLSLFGLRFFGEGWGWSVALMGLFGYLAFLNLILAGFNLLPAFPLDGGRILRSILWGLKDNIRWATQISSKIGSGFGVALILIGIFDALRGNFIGGVWMFVIGMFLRNASQMSYQQLILRRGLEGEPVRKFMISDPVTVAPSITIEELVEKYIYKHHFKLYPVVEGGRLVGCINLSQVKEIPIEERGQHTVAEIAKDCSGENTIGPDEDALKALSLMSQKHISRLMVTEQGKLVGVIALKDMLQLLSLKIDLEK